MSSQQKYTATQLKNKAWNWVQEEAGSVRECEVCTEHGSVQVHGQDQQKWGRKRAQIGLMLHNVYICTY